MDYRLIVVSKDSRSPVDEGAEIQLRVVQASGPMGPSFNVTVQVTQRQPPGYSWVCHVHTPSPLMLPVMATPQSPARVRVTDKFGRPLDGMKEVFGEFYPDFVPVYSR